MDWRKLLPLALVLGASLQADAQSPTYGLGRTPTPEEVRAWDISISPTGQELPPGHGTARDGEPLWVKKGCAGCHGANGYGGRAPVLIKPLDIALPTVSEAGGGHSEMHVAMGGHVMALYSPYATVIWDYINRGMPLNREGTLTADEVYALTAYLLFKNGVIKDDQVIDAQSLPKVKMPNQTFVTPSDWKPGTPRLQGYP